MNISKVFSNGKFLIVRKIGRSFVVEDYCLAFTSASAANEFALSRLERANKEV